MAIFATGDSPALQEDRKLDLIGALAALAVLVRLGLFVINEPFYEGDTRLLVTGHIDAISACLREGRWFGCSGSGVFPLLQNVPSLFLWYLGFSPDGILHGLAYLSFISFVASVVLIFWTLRKKASKTEALIGVVALITSPLLWYSHSTFGEMASAFLILAFAAGVLLRTRGWIIVILFVLAGSTKEVAVPFLFLIGLVCLMPELIGDWRPVSRHLVWLVVGAVLSFALTAGFNYFRFGSLSNPSYMTELFIVPTLRIQSSFFLGIWFSPNGGLFFFWPTFALLYFAILGVLIVSSLKRRGSRGKGIRESLERYLPIVAISILLIFLTLGFSRWYTPLGGFAWGPRYMLPWIPAATMLLLYFYQAEVTVILSWMLGKSLGFALSCLALILVSIPQLALLFDSSVMGRIFAYSECPRVPVIQEGVDYYYQCLQTQLWPRKLLIVELFPVAFSRPALWFILLYAATLIWMCYSIRRELVREKQI